jgi:hypothetical protein
MLALRYVYVLALVVWLGGMIVLGALVAPTVFQVLQLQDPVGGRALAGEAFGAMIGRFHYIAYGAGALMLMTMAAMALLGPRPAHFFLRSGILVIMLGVALYSGFAVLARIDQVQTEAGVLPSRLPATDVRRIEFDQLHELSMRLMMLNMAGALVLLFWEARDPSA